MFIKAYMLNGTKIIFDGWSFYVPFPDEPDYLHLTVNESVIGQFFTFARQGVGS